MSKQPEKQIVDPQQVINTMKGYATRYYDRGTVLDGSATTGVIFKRALEQLKIGVSQIGHDNDLFVEINEHFQQNPWTVPI